MPRIKTILPPTLPIYIGLLLVGWQWLFCLPPEKDLVYQVWQARPFGQLETPYLYLCLNALTLLFPLLLSFDKKVAYYKTWKYLLPAIGIVGALFIAWDVYFTHHAIWGFNPDYYYAPLKLLGLPPGEWLFFLTVPYACVFIYACLRAYLPKAPFAKSEKWMTPTLIGLFSLSGMFFFGKVYASSAFLLAAAYLAWHYLAGNRETRQWFYLAYAISWLPFLLVNGILTGSYTQVPVVLYNPLEFTGIRITSVPIDDSVYSFLLLFMNIGFYEYFKKKD